MTRVFPVPAPASTKSGPEAVPTAARCARFNTAFAIAGRGTALAPAQGQLERFELSSGHERVLTRAHAVRVVVRAAARIAHLVRLWCHQEARKADQGARAH